VSPARTDFWSNVGRRKPRSKWSAR
jgi:hypothetical protein